MADARVDPILCSPDLVGSPTVSLGAADIVGLILPYRSPGLDVIALTLASTPSAGDAADGQALRAAVNSKSPPLDASTAYEGFALYLPDCVDTSAYSGVSFTTAGNLGNCPLRFAARFKAADAGTFSTPCALDECPATSTILVASGATTLTFAGGSGGSDPPALAGLQWEVSVPRDPPGGCTADFTVDDIRLRP